MYTGSAKMPPPVFSAYCNADCPGPGAASLHHTSWQCLQQQQQQQKKKKKENKTVSLQDRTKNIGKLTSGRVSLEMSSASKALTRIESRVTTWAGENMSSKLLTLPKFRNQNTSAFTKGPKRKKEEEEEEEDDEEEEERRRRRGWRQQKKKKTKKESEH